MNNEQQFVLNLGNAAVYQQDRLILDGVNLVLAKGDFCYLVGKTGSGKSSLLKLIYGALPFSRGIGHVVGVDLAKLKKSRVPNLRRKLGIVFQDMHLLTDRNVEENLNFVLKVTGMNNAKKRKDRVAEVLDLVDLPEKKKSMPFALSGGEKQRVMIARALLNHPDLILADEPTGNLDPDTSDEIVRLLHTLSATGQAAVLMATHDYRLLDKFPGKLVRCRNGKVFEEGKGPSEVLSPSDLASE